MEEEKKAVNNIDDHEFYIRKTFAENLKKFRNVRKMSQMELAFAANLSSNFINEIENVKKWPSIKTLTKLVEVLNVEPFLLFAPETVLKINDKELFKAELITLITAVLNEGFDRYTVNSAKDPGDG